MIAIDVVAQSNGDGTWTAKAALDARHTHTDASLHEAIARVAEACSSPFAPSVRCGWKAHEDGQWFTDCGEAFEIQAGGPDENGLRYCCFCGKPLTTTQNATEDKAMSEVPYSERELIQRAINGAIGKYAYQCTEGTSPPMPRWDVVKRLFCCGSTVATAILYKYGLDPNAMVGESAGSTGGGLDSESGIDRQKERQADKVLESIGLKAAPTLGYQPTHGNKQAIPPGDE